MCTRTWDAPWDGRRGKVWDRLLLVARGELRIRRRTTGNGILVLPCRLILVLYSQQAANTTNDPK